MEITEVKMEEIPITDAVPQKRQAGLRARLAVLCLSALALFLQAGCEKKERLYIYNWTYYTPESVIEKFEREYNVTVIYDEFASNEDMYAKIMATNRKGLIGLLLRLFRTRLRHCFPFGGLCVNNDSAGYV